LFVTYNDCFTKSDYTRNLLGGLMKNSLLINRSAEPSYKARRKLVAHAFYASRLKAMTETIFEVIHERLLSWEKWHPTGEIDLVEELTEVQGEIVTSFAIGREWGKEKLPYNDPKTGVIQDIEIGYFIGKLLFHGLMRDSQSINLFFPEFLEHCITSSDKKY
jgi:hypothetical protein